MRPRLGFVIAAPLLVAAVIVTPQLVSPTYATAVTRTESQASAVMDFLSVPPMESDPDANDDGATDVYGNEVTVAVAKYRFDAAGTEYELHSPQTELTRLPSPKS